MRPATLSKVLIVVLAAAASTPSFPLAMPPQAAGASNEFFTDEEIDFIRDAQGLSPRVQAILKLANIRLVTLGIKSSSKDDRELEKRISEIHAELAGKPPAAPPVKPTGKPGEPAKAPPEEAAGPYLTGVTRIELLHGYIEALDEISSDIDDAYHRHLEVRDALEQFEKFCDASIPLLRRFQSRNAAELQAIQDAKSATQEILDNTLDALKTVPKTEKSTKP